MTCFSIQKSLVLSLIAAVFMASCPVAQAQDNGSLAAQTQLIEDKMRAEKNRLEKEAAAGQVDSPIVLELYTTSDCTACIYADRMLYDAMKDKNVIALSCHIKDLSELTRRTEKQGIGDNSTYQGPMDPCVFRLWSYNSQRISEEITIAIPNFIFGGYDQIPAGALSYFQTTLNSYHYAYKNKVLEVFSQWKDDDTITINLPQDPKVEKNAVNASVWLVRYKDMAVERIDEGINKGRVLRFSNIIQDIRHIARWHGHMRTIDVDVAKPQGGKERGGYVVLVAEMMGEPFMAAGKIEDYPTAADRKKPPAAAVSTPSAERAATPATQPAAKAPAPAAPAPKTGTSYITP